MMQVYVYICACTCVCVCICVCNVYLKQWQEVLLWCCHAGAGEQCEEEGLADTKCYELTTTPIPCPSVLLVGVGRENRK